ncbi:hypothetical protein [Vibrio nigripulchritudo]|uniref:hypothetical protein n=1 Tax=Vibrio nigripulchritudo TaxID=28173 RepID=UPI0005F9CF5A|nr:hypothetical protein [Vibrio nigripulchritudo]KJY70364.1 hypothetical protein TW74_23705 [Vibrio nigripulchritudo]
MKFKLIAAASMLSVLAGCNLTNYEPTPPNVTPENIEIARQAFSEVPELKVSDDGYISYVASLPSSGYKWQTTTIKKISYEWSCDNLYSFLEMGFVTKIFFKGKGGREEYFDKARCDAEETN